MAESSWRPQHCCLSHPDQNSSDGRAGEVESLAHNSPKITLHGFEPPIQPKTLDMSSLHYSYVVPHQSLHLHSHNFGYARTVYYSLYTKDGPIRSNSAIYANNPFITRSLPKFVTPPPTACP